MQEKLDTYTLPPAAGPTALNNDIALISIPFAAPLSFIVCKPNFLGQNIEYLALTTMYTRNITEITG